MLGVNVQVAFRQFAKRYHPDKLARNSGSGDDVFIEVRVYLKNPVVRFAPGSNLWLPNLVFHILRETSTTPIRLEAWHQSK
jgi:hypothetical protein